MLKLIAPCQTKCEQFWLNHLDVIRLSPASFRKKYSTAKSDANCNQTERSGEVDQSSKKRKKQKNKNKNKPTETATLPTNINNNPSGMVATAVNPHVPVTQQESTAISTSAP